MFPRFPRISGLNAFENLLRLVSLFRLEKKEENFTRAAAATAHTIKVSNVKKSHII